MAIADDPDPSGLLQGEDPRSVYADDAEHWERVYSELVDACRREGLQHARFEARLAYWRRVRYGRPAQPAAVLQDLEPLGPDPA
jgi:hypothetical protein